VKPRAWSEAALRGGAGRATAKSVTVAVLSATTTISEAPSAGTRAELRRVDAE
jgi:hypothetical protein